MNFNEYSGLEGKHSFLSASKGSWVNYDDEKLIKAYTTQLAAAHGTRLHELAKELILLKQKLPQTNQTLNLYVNEAIGFRMVPEQVLFVSVNCFGTADAIKWIPKQSKLMISDLKTGVTLAEFRQLVIYAAMFCIEYEVDPREINIELRIYQNDEVRYLEPETHDVLNYMSTIKRFDKIIEELKQEGYTNE